MNITAMKQALEALEMLARYENPETRIQVRKPKDGGPIVTMYPHKVATDAADVLRTAIAEAEKQEPVGTVKDLLTSAAWERLDVVGSTKVYLGIPPATQRQWVGLTDGEAHQILEDKTTDWMQKWCAIEAKLKERNHD
jgi:hypothetical protein